MRLRILASLALLASLGLLLAPVGAIAAGYTATGTIFLISDPNGLVPGEIGVGTPFSATFSWNPSASPTSTSATFAQYAFDPSGSDLSITLEVAGTSVSSDPAARAVFNVIDRTSGDSGCCDLVQMYAYGTTSDSLGITALEVLLQDSTKSVFDGTALPTALDLADWDLHQVDFLFGGGTMAAVVQADIETLTANPEPSTGLLVLVGLVGLSLRRYRRV